MKTPKTIGLPKTLYRFRSNKPEYFEDELHKAVNLHQVWCSPTSTQNDPFDMLPSFYKPDESDVRDYITAFREFHGPDISLTGTSYRELARKNGIHNKVSPKNLSLKNEAKIALETTTTSFEATRTASKIACFSEVFDSILLWSHYANAHEGICLEYEVEASMVLHQKAPDLVRMRYLNERPKFSSLEILKYIGYMNTTNPAFMSKSEADDISERAFFTKSKQWEYEFEWRWFDAPDTKSSGYRIILPMKVKSITVGARVADRTIELCRKVIEAGKGVPLFKVKLSEFYFSFEREEI